MNKELLDLILARLAEDFPDTAKTYSAEVFADWLTNLSKQYMEAFNTPQRNSTITAELRQRGLSPTGRRPSQPELQQLPRSYQLPAMKMTEERAKELLQQYRDTFGPHPGGFRNFPCVAVDLASGVDYSVEQHPIQADHASIDDKGNVSVSVAKKHKSEWTCLHGSNKGNPHIWAKLKSDAGVVRCNWCGIEVLKNDSH